MFEYHPGLEISLQAAEVSQWCKEKLSDIQNPPQRISEYAYFFFILNIFCENP